jgi:hypothetical protein
MDHIYINDELNQLYFISIQVTSKLLIQLWRINVCGCTSFYSVNVTGTKTLEGVTGTEKCDNTSH